ncbi:right-handed parallel beta-helix repeat-containing protein [Tumebacillus lipolyticus]|uniref:Nitrous oxide reductase family maturation protein NosD n=1 Tax=Tumebacillus lipolyticus TaxID=1280370 RepID=A0ABW4ZVS4_9BACL
MKAFAKAVWLALPLLTLAALMLPARLPAEAAGAPFDLQRALDSAQPGAEIRLPAGDHFGPVVIRKPIKLVGEGAQLRRAADAAADQPLLLIEANGATVSGLQLTDEQLGLVVRGDDNQILNVAIQAGQTALKMEKSNRNLLRGLKISGSAADVEQRGNGIEVWNSRDNRIEDSTLDSVQDGVYLDNSERTVVHNNRISNSRYAVHMMFSHQSAISSNELRRNVTGVMVMEDQGSKVADNRITEQAEHVQSQGILLFHVQDAQVANNRIEGNRVGLYVDQAEQNRIAGNQILHNFLGVRMTESRNNEFSGNLWAGNVVQAEATDSVDNRMTGNYWDTHQGLDLDGDGRSELPYVASPFFLSLTERAPAYQLFFQTPGLVILEDLFTSSTDRWLRDDAPLLVPPVAEPRDAERSRTPLFMFSSLLLGAGIYPFIRMIRRSVSS